MSVPARIVRIDGLTADVSIGGATFKAGLHMIENAEVGDYVLLHAGFAIQRISEEDATETIKLLKELDEVVDERPGK